MKGVSIWRRLFGDSYTAVNTNNNYNNQQGDEFGVRRAKSGGVKCLRSKCENHVLAAVLGFCCLFGGLFILIFDPYDFVLKWKIVFGEGGEIYEMWREPPIDLYLRVYLFNITNKDEFLNGKEKLRVKEVGPYVYKEVISHKNVTFNSNGTVTAIPSHPLVWVPELSVGDQETDQLYLPHIALLSIADVVSESSYFTRIGLNLLIRQIKSEPIALMSPKEFMFGYESTLMSLGNKFLPGWVSFDKLGLIDRMYNFEGDYATFYTGETDSSLAGLIDTYSGSAQMSQWEGNCGNIKYASDGTKFTSHVNENDTLKFFRKSMCRPQNLVVVNTTTSSGLDGYVYHFTENAMDNGLVNKNNTCYCKTKTCLPRGLLDVRQCYYGFPIALSYPHFLDSDPSLAEQVDGYEPDRQKHESFFIVNPTSGLPLEVAARFQINMALRKIGGVAHVSRFENMVLPLLWTEIRLYQLPNSLANRFRLYLKIIPIMLKSGMVIQFILSIVLLFFSIYKYSRKNKVSSSVAWLDEEIIIDKKSMPYKPSKKSSLSSKEMEVYFNSLVTPLNQDLECEYHELQPFQDLKYIE